MAVSVTPTMEPSTTVVNERYEVEIAQVVQTPLTEDHRAHDLMLDRPVVFKTLADELVTDRGFVERFRRHVQAAANLTHPNITAVYDWGRDKAGIGSRPGPTYYVITERVSGRTVAGYVESKGALPIPRALHVMLGVTAALSYAHRNGTLHGGLRPQVVSVTPNGLAKVSDFGFERSLGVDWSPEEDRPDDAAWRAPELVRSEEPDERTDVYGAGLLLYFLVTGRPPFSGATASDLARKHLDAIPPAPSKTNPEIPRTLEVIIGRSMAKRREDRFATIADLRAALVRFRDSLPGAPVTPAMPIAPIVTAPAAAPAAAPPPAIETPSPGMVNPAITPATNDDDATQWSPFPTPSPPIIPVPPALVDAPHPGALITGVPPNSLPPMATLPPRPPTFAEEPDHPKQGNNDDATVLATAGFRPQGVGGPGEHRSGAEERSPLVTAGTDARRDESGDESGDDATSVLPSAQSNDNPGGPDNPVPPRSNKRQSIWPLAAIFAVLLAVLVGLGWLLISSLNLTSSGGKKVTVPSVVGKSSTDAKTALTDAGLTFKINTATNPSAVADSVYDQSPAAGESIGEGSTVILSVSAGSGVPRVPDVVGQTESAARAVLAAVGLGADKQEREDETAAPGTVIEQIPKADTVIDASIIRVTLVVSKSTGKLAIPDVAGMTPAEVSKAMISFRYVIQGEASPTVEKTKATRTEPAAGTKLDKGGAVTVFVSKGPSVAVPSVIGQKDANALAALTAAGFQVDRRTRPVLDSTGIGVVLEQTPAGGDAAAPGATVSIVIGTLDPSATTTRPPRPTTTIPSSVVGETNAASTLAPVTVPRTAAPVTPAPTEAPTVAPTPAPTLAPPVPVVTQPAAVAPVPVASSVP